MSFPDCGLHETVNGNEAFNTLFMKYIYLVKTVTSWVFFACFYIRKQAFIYNALNLNK